MKGDLILLSCFGFIIWLIRTDIRTRHYSSGALWIPGLWLAMIGSRPIGFWLGDRTVGSNVEGNPLNLLGFVIPIVASLYVLLRRRISWRSFVYQNRALLALYLFYLLSVLWSPVPLASFKRLIKDFGCVLMALVLLTEENPAEAIRLVFTRVAYLLLPLSVVFIKYFPDIGRNSTRNGETMFIGVTNHKNELGQLLVVLGLVMIWDFIEARRMVESPERELKMRKFSVMLVVGGWLRSIVQSERDLKMRNFAIMLVLGGWLLYKSECATARLCVVLAVVLLWLGERLVRMQAGRKYLMMGLVSCVAFFALDQTLGVTKAVVEALGRNTTLTGRTDIWKGVLAQTRDPVLGIGFYSFWETSHATDFYDEMDFIHINTAHNGYLETYLDGGMVGLTLLAIFLLATGKSVIDKLFSGTLFGRLAFIYWLLALMNNYTESDYFRLEPLWFCLLLFGLNYPSQPAEAEAALAEDEEMTVPGTEQSLLT
jgi:exopolysaccharide production protein ExoQ